MRFRFWYIETILVLLFFVILFGISSNPPPENPEFVPDAVNGIATVSGILTAFTGYLISFIIPNLPDTPKKWLSLRIISVIIILAFGLLFVMIGFSELVFGSMEGAYKSALFGTSLTLLAFFEVMFMVVIRESEQTTNMSDSF